MLLHHICIQTPCYAKSLEFYTRVLGFALLQETPGFHTRDYNTWLENEGLYLELQTPKAGHVSLLPEEEHLGLVHLCFCVPDLEATLRHLQDCGVTSFRPKNGEILYTAVSGGRLMKLTAPEGTVIEFRDHPGL